jgi:hypothetical protein
MSDAESDYKVGPGKPPLHTRFRKGQSGNPRGRSAKNLPVLLADALNESVVVTTNGRRRRITKREAVIAQLVNKSAGADLRATKMLIDMLKDIEQKAGMAPPPPSKAPRFTPADEEGRRLGGPDTAAGGIRDCHNERTRYGCVVIGDRHARVDQAQPLAVDLVERAP